MPLTSKQAAIDSFQGVEIERFPFFPITMTFAADLINRPYKEYATNARVLADGQLAVAKQFDTSQVSVVCDPCIESSDLGSSVVFYDDEPPANVEEGALLADKSALMKIEQRTSKVGKRMSNQLDAVRLLAEEASDARLVEGWVEGPCAEAADLRGINRIMMDFYEDPKFANALLDFVTDLEIDFALAQVKEGATVIGIGDAASSLVSPALYKEFILPRTKRYFAAIHGAGALIRLHICGEITHLFPHLAELEIDLIDMDSMNSMTAARQALGAHPVICSNLDPVHEVKEGTPASIRQRLEAAKVESGRGFAVGAGCEIPRDTPVENLKAMQSFAQGTPE